MRRLVLFVLALVASVECKKTEPALATMVGFEGEIEITTWLPSGTGKLSLVVKNEKLRYEDPSVPDVIGIADGQTMRTLTVFPKLRTYREGRLPPPTATSPAPVITKTGKRATIAGYECETVEVRYASGAPWNELCVATSLGLRGVALVPLQFLGGTSDVDGFSLRTIQHLPSGAATTTMEVTRIEKKSEPDDLFEAPPGFMAK